MRCVGYVGRTKMHVKFWMANFREEHLGDQSMNGRIILKIRLREIVCENVDGTG
jgi:hypothetical protein